MKILIVSPFFPPTLSVATIRISSLTRYLLEKDHKITVLTNDIIEPTEELNRIDIFENVDKIRVDISENNGKYIKNRDSYIRMFRRIMDVERFDIVLITAGPYYTLPLCKISKTEYNTNCVIDFRDLWIFDIRNLRDFLKPKSLLKKLFFFPIEYQAIKYSNNIITVTKGWANILKRVYPSSKKKIKVIYNGFDKSYLESVKSRIDEDRLNLNQDGLFYIMVFGKLTYYSKDYSMKFFRAINDLQKEYKNLRLIQIGAKELQTNEIINETNFPKNKYINTGFIDYVEGVSILKTAHLTLIIDIRKKAIGTKIYDYVYVNKPIIYIGKKRTYLSDFVSSFENGFSCQTENDIKNAIRYILENNVRHLTSNESYHKYSRELQNKRFTNILELNLNSP